MSRIGRKPVIIPLGVTVIFENQLIKIAGPKGELNKKIEPFLLLDINNTEITVSRINEKKNTKSYHGLIGSLLHNMLLGVVQPFSKRLIVEGVGYKFSLNKNEIFLTIGFSHSISFLIPENLILTLESSTKLTILGIDKEQVGFFAAKIRSMKIPEPYKGKGIRYHNEKILRKMGKKKK